MIYSQWQPDTGKYRYFEATEKRGLGDDLPTPMLGLGEEIGLPSVEAGRKLPSSSRYVGEGDQPRGSITPAMRKGLAGVSGLLDLMPLWAWVASSITLGWLLGVRYQTSRKGK